MYHYVTLIAPLEATFKKSNLHSLLPLFTDFPLFPSMSAVQYVSFSSVQDFFTNDLHNTIPYCHFKYTKILTSLCKSPPYKVEIFLDTVSLLIHHFLWQIVLIVSHTDAVVLLTFFVAKFSETSHLHSVVVILRLPMTIYRMQG